MFFNFIANYDLRGVFAFELDAIWGLPRQDASGSGGSWGMGPMAPTIAASGKTRTSTISSSSSSTSIPAFPHFPSGIAPSWTDYRCKPLRCMASSSCMATSGG